MAVNWNPHGTGTLGLEWFPTQSQIVTIDNAGVGVAAYIPSLAAENIGTLRVGIPVVTTPGTYGVDVFLAGTELGGGPGTLTARPNEDIALVNAKGYGVDTAGNRYQNIDESSLFSTLGNSYANTTDFIGTTDSVTSPCTYQGRLGVGVGGLANRVVTSVTLKWYARNNKIPFVYGSLYVQAMTDAASGLVLSSNVYGPSTADSHNLGSLPSLGTADPSSLRYITWNKNPRTGVAWTIADCEALDTTDSYFISLALGSGATIHLLQPSLQMAWLEITYTNENRIASGSLNVTTPGWNDFALTTPPSGGVWAKSNATLYTYVLKRLSASGSIGVRTLDSGTASISGHASYPAVSLDSAGRVSAMGTVSTKIVPTILRTTAPADSGDSQTYYDLVAATIKTGQLAKGEFSNAGALLYGNVTFLVKHGGAPSADLLVKIKKVSDNSQQGSTLNVTKALSDATSDAGSGWKKFNTTGIAATLAAATQYYWEFSSAATGTGTDYWQVACLDALSSAAPGTGFGGTTDAATINGGSRDTRYDFPATIASIPAALTGLTASLLTQTLPTLSGLPTMTYAHVVWNTASGGFSYYELQRSEDGGTTYYTIAKPTSIGTLSFDDYEGKRGVSCTYRVRYVRDDLAISAWSSTSSVTPTVSGSGLYFATNSAPTQNCGYRRALDIQYDFPSAANVVVKQVYQRDFQVAFVPTEQRGVMFTIELQVGAQLTPTIQGVSAFDLLRAITTNATAPYIAVFDTEGNRWFANVTVAQGTFSGPGKIYIAPVTVTEVTQTPTPI